MLEAKTSPADRGMTGRKRRLLILALAAVFIGAVSAYMATRTPFEERRPRVGAWAPEIGLADLSGRMVLLSDLRGQVVLVNYWASWCPPCKREFGWFQELYDRYEPEGFQVVGLSIDDVDPGLVVDLGVTFPIAVANPRVTEAYGGITDVPVSFLVGRDGRILRKVRKVYSESSLRRDIEEALAVPAPPE